MTTRAVFLVAIGLLAAACGPTHTPGSGGDAGSAASDSGGGGVDSPPLPHVLTSISVTPLNQLVQLDLNVEGSQGFTATGNYEDGTTDDQSGSATWTVSNAMVGSMTGSTLLIPAFTQSDAQTATVTATVGGLTGQAQITVVAYRQTGPATDFFFILPYQDGSGAQTKPLAFSTAIPALDVFFLMDTTASMTGEIKNLQSGLSTVISDIQTAVPNTEFGIGSLQDFPIAPYGSVDPAANSANNCAQGSTQPDQPLKVFQTITATSSLLTTAVSELSTTTNGQIVPIGCGNDIPEGGQESVYQAATGNGLTGPSPTNIPANHTGIGGVAFRAGTMPVIVPISDAGTHGPDITDTCVISDNQGDSASVANQYTGAVAAVAHTRQQTKDAVAAICGRVVGVSAIPTNFNYTASCLPTSWMTDLATASGARVPPGAWDVGVRPTGCSATQCCTGQNGVGQAPDANGLCPMVFKVGTDGTGVSTNIATGIQMLARFAQFTVTDQTVGVGSDIDGNALPSPHTTADFVKSVQPTGFTVPMGPPVVPNPTFDQTSFQAVTPGTVVDFAVNAFNDFVPATSNAQIFKATIKVLAGGCTALDQRDVLILVPPAPITIN